MRTPFYRSRGELYDACKSVLGNKVYHALRGANVALPELLKLAGLELFTHPDQHSDQHLHYVVREALAHLEDGGIFE